MPLVYADTSALFAYFHPDDEFSAVVDAAAQTQLPDFVYWRFLRYELRHNLRLTRTDRQGEVVWRAPVLVGAVIICMWRRRAGCICLPSWRNSGRATRPRRCWHAPLV